MLSTELELVRENQASIGRQTTRSSGRFAVAWLVVWTISCEGFDPPVPDDHPTPIYDLGATTKREGFYDHPFPSDVRRTLDGAPDLSTFYDPVGTPLLPGLRDAVERDIRGFSPISGVYFRFSMPLDPLSLPASVEESLDENSSVFLVDVDPTSPERGRHHPVEVAFYEHGGRYWRPNMLVIRPPLTMPLRPATRYAAVVTRAVRGLDGEIPAESDAFVALLTSDAPADRQDEWEVMRFLVELPDEEEITEEPLVASVFTTADHLGDMRRLRQWIHDHVPEPEATGWEVLREPDAEANLVVYAGRFEMMDFLAGEPPYATAGEGIIRFDEDRQPLPGQMVSVRFALSVPLGDPPPGGWPLALYSHGAGGNFTSFIEPEGRWAARAGVAMLSMDNPMNGERNPDGSSFVDYLVELAVEYMNVAAGRDMYRHGVADQVQLARLALGDLAVPAEVSHTGGGIDFDPTHLAFTSHSMGSQIGTILVAVEPTIESAFFSEGGGGAAAAFLLRKTDDLDLEAMVALALGVDIDREPLSGDHPVVGLLMQTLLDPADPLNYALGAIREPAGAPIHILMTEGLEDDQTIPVTIEALSAAYGLPLIEPVVQVSQAHLLWGLETAEPPARNNVDVGPRRVTGGVIQFGGQGHYALYNSERAHQLFIDWLESAVAGTPVITAPEAR
jgi:hypothetical protein